jgi:hypothetical protein
MRGSSRSRRLITVTTKNILHRLIFYAVLSNPDRKKHYDRYGTLPEDDDGDAAF